MTTPLAEALDRAWDLFGGSHTLLPQLPLDAAVAQARAHDTGIRSVTARLLELATGAGDRPELLGEEPVWAPVDLLVHADWRAWPVRDRGAVTDVFDAWWAQTLALEPAPPGVEVVLGTLVHSGVPLIRWLEPWLGDLDGLGAVHLADLVLGGLQHPVWVGFEDQRGQIVGWVKTEPVVMGLTVVGGIHLGDGILSRVLERILE